MGQGPELAWFTKMPGRVCSWLWTSSITICAALMNTNLFTDCPLGSWLFKQINTCLAIYRPLLPLTPLQDKQQSDNLLVPVVGFVWFDSIWFIAFLLDSKAPAVSAKPTNEPGRGRRIEEIRANTAETSFSGEVVNPEQPFPLQAWVYSAVSGLAASHHLGSVGHVSQDGTRVSEGTGMSCRAWAVFSKLLAENHFPEVDFLALKLHKVKKHNRGYKWKLLKCHSCGWYYECNHAPPYQKKTQQQCESFLLTQDVTLFGNKAFGDVVSWDHTRKVGL